MSYNPARMEGGGHPRKVRHTDPHAGIKHSQIVSSMGPQAARVEDMRNRQDLPYGWRIPAYKGPTFEVEYQFMCRRNSLGRMRHDTKSRCVRVLAGQVFVLTTGGTQSLTANQTITFEAGVEYGLATSGVVDAEMYFCQDADYQKDLVQVSPPEAVNIDLGAFAAPDGGASRVYRENSPAQAQAKMMADEKAARRTPTARVPKAPLPGQTVVGMNPRPVGAGGYKDEG
jgi:hypothetical protein